MMRGIDLVNSLATLVVLALGCAVAPPLAAEDGYDLWLRYAPLEARMDPDEKPRANAEVEVLAERTPTIDAALAELALAAARMADPGKALLDRVVLARSERLPGTDYTADGRLVDAATGAFSIRTASDKQIIISANDDIGLLYGTFAYLRHVQVNGSTGPVEHFSAPAMPLRMLNHWDNPDGHVERGYAGRSIFDWWHLPERLDRRMVDYARANASIGINGVVVNNVNARAFMLEPRYIAKYKRLADAWRPYGIRLYVSVRFSAPQELGGLDTSDPADPRVGAWWKAKADEFYAAIPDFGGFLVKANSEGQPGPQDYGRSHALGANMLASAIGERGTVIWRAFVYSAEDETDRAKQAFAEFVPLDGQFADNVIIQVKNGPIDFQPREPFHPMFGAMPDTRLMLEAQVTKEYLGFASHLAFLAPLWEEVLDRQTGRAGTVAEVVAPAGLAGVANTGSGRNWSGSIFDQANWYAFGRLAWDPSLSSQGIAREWASLTLTHDPNALETITDMMMHSREAVVRYMTPLGLAHLMDTGHHYGPAPWVCELQRPEWNPCYYHRADAGGIGFDRTETGSDALSQYAGEVADGWRDPASIDPRFLLWFHRVAWDAPRPSGATLWEELVHEYDRGVAQVDRLVSQWAGLAGVIDEDRHRAIAENLAIQQKEARWWRDASIAYWQSLNGLPLPDGVEPPALSLDAYRNRRFPEAPGQ